MEQRVTVHDFLGSRGGPIWEKVEKFSNCSYPNLFNFIEVTFGAELVS